MSSCSKCFKNLFFPDKPTASLKLGSSLNASNIKEGDDVYFECSVNSNPRPNKIVWMKDVSTISRCCRLYIGYSIIYICLIA